MTALVHFLHQSLLWLDKVFFQAIGRAILNDGPVAEASSEMVDACRSLQTAMFDAVYFSTKRKAALECQAHILRDLCEYDILQAHFSMQAECHKTRIGDTGRWFLGDKSHLRWREGKVSTLWFTGRGSSISV